MAVPTYGVEEEFFLADADGHQPREDAAEIIAAARKVTDDSVDQELRSAMAETGTAVCSDADMLRRELTRNRSALADVAGSRGAIVLASGTHPTAKARRVGFPDDDRYQRMAEVFGRLADEAFVCGCHVHVQVPDRVVGVQVIDRIGGWLPALLALSANSPYWEGRDTSFDSWRARVWSRWPTAGPTTVFGGLDAYEQQAEQLIAVGAALDRGMICYDARLSEHYPTVEIRVADVCTDPDDAVLIAVLARALVMTATASASSSVLPVELRRAAGFTAARSGLSGGLLDPERTRVAPAADVLHALLAAVRPALVETGEDELAAAGVRRLLERGNGATRQRAAWQDGGPAAVVEAITVR